MRFEDLGFKIHDFLFDFVIYFNHIFELRFVFVLIFETRMIFEKSFKVLKVVNWKSGSVFLELIFKVIKFVIEVESAVTVFHHLLSFFPVLYFSFERLLLVWGERNLEDQFGSFVGIFMPIFLKRVQFSEYELDVFGSSWKSLNHLLSRRVIFGKSHQTADEFTGSKSLRMVLGMNAVCN